MADNEEINKRNSELVYGEAFSESIEDIENELTFEDVSEAQEEIQTAIDSLDEIDYTKVLSNFEKNKKFISDLSEASDQTGNLNDLVDITKDNSNVLDELIDAEEEFNERLIEANDARSETNENVSKTPLGIDDLESELLKGPDNYMATLEGIADALGDQFEQMYGETVDEARGIVSIDKKDEPTNTDIMDEMDLSVSPETILQPIESKIPEINVNVESPIDNVVTDESNIIEIEPAAEPVKEVEVIENNTETINNNAVEKETIETNNNFEKETVVVEKEPVSETIEVEETVIQVDKTETTPLLDENPVNVNSTDDLLLKISESLSNLPAEISAAVSASISNLPTKKSTEIVKSETTNTTSLVKSEEPTREISTEDDKIEKLTNLMLMVDRRLMLIQSVLSSPLDVRIKHD